MLDLGPVRECRNRTAARAPAAASPASAWQRMPPVPRAASSVCRRCARPSAHRHRCASRALRAAVMRSTVSRPMSRQNTGTWPPIVGDEDELLAVRGPVARMWPARRTPGPARASSRSRHRSASASGAAPESASASNGRRRVSRRRGDSSGVSLLVLFAAPRVRAAPVAMSIRRIAVSSSRSVPVVCQVTATRRPSAEMSSAARSTTRARASGVRSTRSAAIRRIRDQMRIRHVVVLVQPMIPVPHRLLREVTRARSASCVARPRSRAACRAATSCSTGASSTSARRCPGEPERLDAERLVGQLLRLAARGRQDPHLHPLFGLFVRLDLVRLSVRQEAERAVMAEARRRVLAVAARQLRRRRCRRSELATDPRRT